MDFVYMEQRDKVKLVINSLQTPWWLAAILIFSTQIGQMHQTASEIDFPYLNTPERTPYMPYFVKSIKMKIFIMLLGGHF